MTREWKWKSKSGSAYFHAGCGTQDAVGAEKPSEAIPLQEGVRILFGRGVDHVWFLSLIGGLRSFDLIWAMTGGGPGFATDVMASVIYKQYAYGFYGLSTAGNVIMLILISLIAFPLQHFLNKREEAIG